MLIKNEKYFMFRDAIPYSGSVWYIKEIATKKTVAIISKTSIYNNQYDYNNQYVLIDFWQDTKDEQNDELRNFTHFYTNIKIENQQIAQVAKKLFKNLKDSKEERIKEALNLFPDGVVGRTVGKK